MSQKRPTPEQRQNASRRERRGAAREERRSASPEERRRRQEAERRRAVRRRVLWVGGGGAVLVALVVALVLATRTQAAPTIDGVQCNQLEGSVTHIHQHLAIFDRGKAVAVPAGIGTREANTSSPCLFWLHTHAGDGVIHVESPTKDAFTLGQFFDIWGQPLSRTKVTTLKADATHQIRAYVNGRLFRGDPRTIPLTAHALITLEAGPPWVTPQPYTFPQGD
jgi:hypothetical protein